MNETREEGYRLKQLLTIQRLRAYKNECLLKDLEKGVDVLEIEIIHGF